MEILVTGATGYIGYEFVKKACSKYKIIVLVRENSDIEKLKKLNCTISTSMEEIFTKYSICGIVHFASEVTVEHEKSQIESIINSNIVFGTLLLEYAKQYQIKWFLNTGTFWQNYQNEDYNPVNLYAATKEALGVIAKYYTNISNLVFTTIKLNDTFGLNDTRKKIFNLWIENIKLNHILEMSKGEQIIDISYIDDIVNAFLVMIINLSDDDIEQYNHKTYIVSNNKIMTLKQLSILFENIVDSKLKIKWGAKRYRDREVMIPYNKGNLVPNWKQEYSLEEAIKLTVQECIND